MSRIWIPLPDRDFDTTEVAVPWRILTNAGHQVVFATETGEVTPACDPLLLSGVIFGQLGAEAEPKAFYQELIQSPEFRTPVSWASLEPSEYDGLVLPGGHAKGMRQYLGSEELQQKVVAFWKLKRPVGAICHGVLVLARAIDPETQKSVISDYKTTCLPGFLEWLGYALTFWKLGRYYRTYPAYVETEVRAALDSPKQQFQRGPLNFAKDAFVVEDRHYVSGRWPGDAYLFAQRFLERLT